MNRILPRMLMLLLLMVMVSSCASNSPGPTAKGGADSARPIRILNTNTPPLAGGNEVEHRKVAEPLTLEQLRKKYPSNFIFQGPSEPKRVALTFDDVPDELFTLQVLDALKKHGVRATFFVVGNRAEDHPEVVKRMVEDGHVLGNHSYSHVNFPKVSNDEFHEEVLMTQKAVDEVVGGYQMKYIRPPYGNIADDQIKWLVSQKLKIVNWNVDSLDWKGIDADEVEKNIMSQVKPGSIILQHGAGGAGEDLSGTVQALPRIIQKLQDQGYEFVTLPELIHDKEQ